MYFLLNPFPTLLDLSFFAPLLLRLVLGASLLVIGYLRLTHKREHYRMVFIDVWKESGVPLLWILGALEMVSGIMFVLGAYTQLAAIIGIVIGGLAVAMKQARDVFGHDRLFYALVLVISFALLLSGAGPFGFDFPL